jgi:biopolymer transport protein ExbD
MKLETGYENKSLNIELIALIDVVFLLLVFFIYAMLSMAVRESLDMTLPDAQGSRQEQGIVVTLDRDNRFFLEGKVMRMSELVPIVSRRHMQSGLPVIIQGDRSARLGEAIELMAELRREGIEAVSFQVGNRGGQE